MRWYEILFNSNTNSFYFIYCNETCIWQLEKTDDKNAFQEDAYCPLVARISQHALLPGGVPAQGAGLPGGVPALGVYLLGRCVPAQWGCTCPAGTREQND